MHHTYIHPYCHVLVELGKSQKNLLESQTLEQADKYRFQQRNLRQLFKVLCDIAERRGMARGPVGMSDLSDRNQPFLEFAENGGAASFALAHA